MQNPESEKIININCTFQRTKFIFAIIRLLFLKTDYKKR